MTKINKAAVIFLLMAGFLLLPARPAKADLTITPVRVVFQGRNSSAQVELLNTSNRTNTYRIKWLMMEALPGGGYKPATAANDQDPHTVPGMIRFSPRQVKIEPHGYQIVRLSLRRPPDLAPGEYRAHLAFVRLAHDEPPPKDDKKEKSIALNVNLGWSIPVIVRNGDDSLKISLSSPQLRMIPGTLHPLPALHVEVNRAAGKFSSYGGIEVYWQPPQGVEKKIGEMGNVALYPELTQRHVDVPLQENPTGGRLRVVYRGKYESEGTVWDEKAFPIGK